MLNDIRSICIIAHYAYGAMTGGASGHIGGVEKQTALTARWLARQGHPVSILTWVEGTSQDEYIEGVRIIKMCKRQAGWPGIRFFYPRWTSLCQAMRIASADVYYQNCAEYVTGQIALWCQLHRKRFVYSVASDPDCDKLLPKMRTTREKILYRYGIRHADHIIVQTNRQQEMLRSNFGRKAEVIAMACPGPGPSWTPPTIDERQPKRVLWVGRVAPVKQLEWLLDIAELAPDLVFEVAGPLDKSDYVQKLQKRAEQLSNVILRGAVQRSDMPLCYTSAAVMCCTSSYEGFPNTFLEAWSHGTPVISTVDPDNVISKLQLGEIGHTPNELLASIRLLLEAPKRWKIISKNARCYYLQNHTEEKVLPQFEQAFFSNLSKNN
jgi:glycosyltransferase involved in cell wall biosynthesis